MALSRLKRDTIITNPFRTWLVNHGNDPIERHIAERVFQTITRSGRYRPGSISASSASFCKRRQILGYLNTEVPDSGKTSADLQQIFANGTYTHMRWQANLLSAGLLDDIEVGCVNSDARAYGSMDGVGTAPANTGCADWRGRRFGFELKSMNSYAYDQCVKNDKVKDEHLAQIHRYFVLTGLDLFVYIIENKDNNKFHEWVIEPDSGLLKESRDELLQLNLYIDTETLPTMLNTCSAKMGPKFKGCPFAKICSDARYTDNIDYTRVVV